MQCCQSQWACGTYRYTSTTWNSVQDFRVFVSNRGNRNHQPLPVASRCLIHIVIDDAAGNILVDKNIFQEE